jgi:excisionase family DNA binding protein
LDGDPRILIPLPEVAERLRISRWQAYKLARSGRLPTTRLGARDLHVPAAVLRRIEQEGQRLVTGDIRMRTIHAGKPA